MAVPILDSGCSVAFLLEENAFTLARLPDHPLAAPLAARFEAFAGSVGRLLAADDDLDGVLEALDEALLTAVAGDRGEPFYARFFGEKGREDLARAVVAGELSAVRALVPLVRDTANASVRALHGELERCLAAADDAVLAHAGVEGTIRDFRSAGQREALVDHYNELRKEAEIELSELRERHPDEDLPEGFADRFFRRSSGLRGPRRPTSAAAVQARIRVVEADLGELREQLAAITAHQQAEEALADAQRAMTETAAKVAALEARRDRKG